MLDIFLARLLLFPAAMRFFLALLIIIYTLPLFAVERVDLYADLYLSPKVVECVSKALPSMAALGKDALQQARIVPDDISRWKRNIKKAALLPRLQVGYERKVTDNVNVDVADNVSVTSGGSVVGPTSSAWNQKYDQNNNITVTAIWYLDELVFNRDDLSISSEARAQISARRDLLGAITESYYELQKRLSIYLSNSSNDAGLKGKLALEMDDLSNKIDMLTGGYFTGQFQWRGVRCE